MNKSCLVYSKGFPKVALRPEHHLRQRAFGDGENAIARAMQNGEKRCQHRPAMSKAATPTGCPTAASRPDSCG